MTCIVVTVPDGLAARNFCNADFISSLQEHAEVVLWHHLAERSLEELATVTGAGARLVRLPPVTDGRVLPVVRLARTLAQLRRSSEPQTAAARARIDGASGARARLRRRAALVLAQLARGQRGLDRLDRLHDRLADRLPTVPEATEFLRSVDPDVVFVPNQRSLPALPVVAAARRLGIPVAAFVYSWDNLPKRRSTVVPDHWLVWGPRMGRQVLRFHPGTDAARVHQVGTPQFEVHTRSELVVGREEFLRGLGLDPDRPVVCFSGDDATTSPFDQVYLRDLAEAVATMPERPQILFRRAPVDKTSRYDEVLSDHPEVVASDPVWFATGQSWEGVIPSRDDDVLLANVVAHSDVVVNVGSTMAMDFAVRDKPAVYLAYQPVASDDWSIDTIYRLPHFRSVHRTTPVLWARERGRLAEVLGVALANPAELGPGRKAWLAEELTEPVAGASARCASVLLDVARHAARPDRTTPGVPR